MLVRQAGRPGRRDACAAIFETDRGIVDRATYGELNARVNRIGHALIGQGVRHGDRVAVLGRNSLQYVAIYFALAKLGAIMVPVNFWYRASEIGYTLEQSGASYLLLAEQFADVAESVAKLAAPPRTISFGSPTAELERLAVRTSSSTRAARPAFQRGRCSPIRRTTSTPSPGRSKRANTGATSASSSTRSFTPAARIASSCPTSSSAARSSSTMAPKPS
jgi:acyl-CoA synthetase (AMP-forming)/AMP-acid ligase II